MRYGGLTHDGQHIIGEEARLLPVAFERRPARAGLGVSKRWM